MKHNIIWQDLEFFLSRLKALPVSESFALGEKGFCVSTNNKFENWIYYPEKIDDANLAKQALKFFAERDMSFMWPLYDGSEEILKSAGLLYAGNLEAMSLETNKSNLKEFNNDVKIKPADTIPNIWAETVWRAFEYGTGEVAEEYYALVEAFNNDKDSFSLYLAELSGKPAGTFLLTHEQSLTGVYYFGVIPELRHKKIAASMMNEICRLSNGKKIVLQATPSGVPFYTYFGFKKLFTIPVYSIEGEIF